MKQSNLILGGSFPIGRKKDSGRVITASAFHPEGPEGLSTETGYPDRKTLRASPRLFRSNTEIVT